jgi:hypothetical protein
MASSRRAPNARSLLASLALLLPVPAAADCTFAAPKTVSLNQRFALCGPEGAGYTWEWRGAGLTSRERCLNVPGLPGGEYEFELTTRWNDGSPERCKASVVVGSGASGGMRCEITGPAALPASGHAMLCAPAAGFHRYRWSGPGGRTSGSRCVEATEPGRYTVTIRNSITGYTRRCSQWLDAGDPAACGIAGPETIAEGGSARLCGPGGAKRWRWEGPGGFTSTARCVRAEQAGTWVLASTDQATGRTSRCTHRLAAAEPAACEIDGPARIADDARVRLCAKSYANADYLWEGPGGARSRARCMTASRQGVYRVTVRDRTTGHRLQCEHRLETGLVDARAPGTAPLSARAALTRLPFHR